jgi:hypothetical protein
MSTPLDFQYHAAIAALDQAQRRVNALERARGDHFLRSVSGNEAQRAQGAVELAAHDEKLDAARAVLADCQAERDRLLAAVEARQRQPNRAAEVEPVEVVEPVKAKRGKRG